MFARLLRLLPSRLTRLLMFVALLASDTSRAPLRETLTAAEPTPAPLPADEATRTMQVPAGFSVRLFAAEPDLIQPVSFCIDPRGRVIVAEALNYGEWKPTGNDRILILEDTDGDGRADSRKLFYEGLNYVTGLEVGFGGVWVMSPPSLFFIPDRDGDDRPDGPPVVLFDGFGHKESRHNLANGFTWGPDGWLYAGHGRTSPSDVGRPGTPANQRIHCDGGVYRIHPTRLVFENFADGTTNPWGVDFDDYGQCFVSNCVNPHLFHMLQGGHYEPWRNRPSSRYAYERIATIADHLHYPTGRTSAMRGETPETLAMGGGHAHCGTLVYLGDQFPDDFRNSVLMCNVHGRRVNRDQLVRHDSGYVATHGRDLLVAQDPWFMGVTLRTGPQGSVFVSDWSDTGECHTYKPNRQSGRIYEIRYDTGRLATAPQDLARLSDLELAQRHLHRNDYFVRHARRLLQERAARSSAMSPEALAFLRDMLAQHADVTRRLRALWTLQATAQLTAENLAALLHDREPWLRAWAIQLLCETSPPADALARFEQLAKSDESPVVRLYLAAALQRLPLDDRWSLAMKLVGHAEDSDDANLPLMIWYGIEPLVPADSSRAVELLAGTRIPLVRRHLARRFVDLQLSTAPRGSLDALFLYLAKEQSAEASRAVLSGAHEALRGVKNQAVPVGWAEAYARLSRHPDPAIHEETMALALIFGDPRALDDLRRLAFDSSAVADRRRRALSILTEQRVADLAPQLLRALDDEVLRIPALRGLAAYRDRDVPNRILAGYGSWSSEEKTAAIATLAARPEYAAPLLDAVEKQQIPRSDISAFAARQIFSANDAQLSERLKRLWGEVRDTPEHKRKQIAKYKAQLTPAVLQLADLENGRALFRKNCGQCHRMYGEGGRVGPDLTGSNRANLDYLLSNIVDPSAEINQDFRMSIVHTSDGRVLNGIIVERQPNRVTVQTAMERLTLSPTDIDTIEDSQVSIMPEGQLEPLNSQQIRDLIGFLSGQTTAAR